MSHREELSFLYKDLKRRLQDVEAKVHLARVERNVLAERIITLELKNKGSLAETESLLKMFVQVSATHPWQQSSKEKGHYFYAQSQASRDGVQGCRFSPQGLRS